MNEALPQSAKISPPVKHPRCSRLLLGTLAATAICGATTQSHAEDGIASRVHALMNFEFSDKYLTPRGMIVHDSGLTFQQLTLGFFNIYKGDTFINDVTAVGGVWNDFNTEGVSENAPFGSEPKTHWVEIDPIAGISVSFAKHFKLDVTYTAFNMQILGIGTSQHLETRLSFNDAQFMGPFALNPYFLYWLELEGKATAAQVPYMVFLGESGPGPSYYFEVGIAPSYTFENIGLKLEAPMRVLLPNKDFYGEFYDSSSTVGLYEVGLKGSIPLKFMPQGYGNWGFHVGFRYMGFEDENLASMQEFNAPGKKTDDTWQVYSGISIFF